MGRSVATSSWTVRVLVLLAAVGCAHAGEALPRAPPRPASGSAEWARYASFLPQRVAGNVGRAPPGRGGRLQRGAPTARRLAAPPRQRYLRPPICTPACIPCLSWQPVFTRKVSWLALTPACPGLCCAAKCGAADILEQTSFEGGGLKYFSGIASVDQCCGLCRADLRCGAFTYDKFRNECWTKYSSGFYPKGPMQQYSSAVVRPESERRRGRPARMGCAGGTPTNPPCSLPLPQPPPSLRQLRQQLWGRGHPRDARRHRALRLALQHRPRPGQDPPQVQALCQHGRAWRRALQPRAQELLRAGLV